MDMKTTKAPDVGITVPAAAARVGVAELDIRDAIHLGTIAARVRILIDPADVDAWAEKRKPEMTR